MSDRKKLKEAIKTIIRKSLTENLEGKGVLSYEVKPAPSDLSYVEGYGLKDVKLEHLKPFVDLFKAIFMKEKTKGKGLEYYVPEFEEYEGGLVAHGMKKKRKGKGMDMEMDSDMEQGGLIANGLVAHGMSKKKGKSLIGLAQRPVAELPYTELYGEGFSYDKQGERKKGAPRGDKGAALKKFNDIVRQLRAKDSSMTLAEARAKAKTIYRS